jgi:hypothetical protein
MLRIPKWYHLWRIPEDSYIDEPGKGKSHHTSEFNRGYDQDSKHAKVMLPQVKEAAIQKALMMAEMVL